MLPAVTLKTAKQNFVYNIFLKVVPEAATLLWRRGSILTLYIHEENIYMKYMTVQNRLPYPCVELCTA